MDEIKNKISKVTVIAFGSGEAARQMIQNLLSTFMLFYLVNFGGVRAIAVGIIILIARIWDAINDPIMGYIVENTNTRFGKARPYILFCSIPAVFLTFLVFAVPSSLSHTMKIIWVAVAYIGGGTLLTAVDVPYNTLMVRITKDPYERLSLARSKSIMGIVGGMSTIFIVNTYTSKAVNAGHAFTKIIGIICIVIALAYLFLFIGTKERLDNKRKKIDFRVGIKVLLYNENWIKIMLIYFLYSITYSMEVGSMLFYLTSYFKRPEMLTNIMAFVIVGMLISSFSAKKLSQKFGKRNVLLGGVTLSAVGILVRIITGDPSLLLFAICSFCSQSGYSFLMVSVPPIIADTIDYGEVKNGVRIESMSYAGLTFASKTGIGISTAILSLMLDKAGYIEGAVNQSTRVIKALFTASAIIPFCCIILMILLAYSYNLDKKNSEKQI